jgi:hypothetical protein
MNLLSAGAALVAAAWLAMQTAPQASASAALDEAEAQWRRQQPPAYEFSIEVRCFCPGLLQRQVSFRVTRGKVQPLEELEPASQRLYEHYNTVDKLFAAIQRAIMFGGHKIAVEYDADLGFPSKADLDPRERVADDELSFKVTAFRKLEASVRSGLLNTQLPHGAAAWTDIVGGPFVEGPAGAHGRLWDRRVSSS